MDINNISPQILNALRGQNQASRPGQPARTVEPTYYGTISPRAAHDMRNNEAKLRRAGVEVSKYDFKEGVYYARFSAEAREMAKDLVHEFNIVEFPRYATDDDWLRGAKNVPLPELNAELAYQKFWLHQDDGNFAAHRSFEQEMRSVEIEAITGRLKQHAAEHAAKFSAASAPKSNTPALSM